VTLSNFEVLRFSTKCIKCWRFGYQGLSFHNT